MSDKQLKYFICLFKLEGHTTWRLTSSTSVDIIEKSLKLAKVTHKRYYEIDRLTGIMEEF